MYSVWWFRMSTLINKKNIVTYQMSYSDMRIGANISIDTLYQDKGFNAESNPWVFVYTFERTRRIA